MLTQAMILWRGSPSAPAGTAAGSARLERLLFEVGRHGFEEVVVLAGPDGADGARAAVASEAARRFALQIRVVPIPAGSGSTDALRAARAWAAPCFLFLDPAVDGGGSDLNLLAPLPVALDRPEAALVLALRAVADASGGRAVRCADGRVTRVEPPGATSGPGLVATGVALVRRSLLDAMLNARTPGGCLMREGLDALAAEGRLGGALSGGGSPDTAAPRRPAVFFDRDGVLNHDAGYVGSRERFRWTETAQAAVRACNDAGAYVFIVTNQSGVARGLYAEADVATLHAWMRSELRLVGAHVDDIRYCPYHVAGTVPRYARDHAWRKPSPGMVTDLLAHWPVDAARSILVGDQPSDMQAAAAAGIRGHLFSGGDLRALLAGLGFAGPPAP